MIKNKLFMLLIPLLLCGTGLFAQNAAVRGIVTGSPDGKPIAGASVVVKGSVRGTTTDASGAYTVAAGTGDVLVISFLGYKPQEVPVAGRTAVDVELQEDAELVEEVIVIGYGTMKKSDLTGSVASVKASDVTQVSAGSIDKLLQGRVAGLTVIDNSNDSPEGSVTMRVRGISSINGSNSPLVVVDGVPMGDAGNLTSVNPNIIESVEVLKDASATAIYGSRGANGVIMITTKNGQKDHRNVWFSGRSGSAFSATGSTTGAIPCRWRGWKTRPMRTGAPKGRIPGRSGGRTEPIILLSPRSKAGRGLSAPNGQTMCSAPPSRRITASGSRAAAKRTATT